MTSCLLVDSLVRVLTLCFAQAEKASTKMKAMKEEMERLRALADDRERLSMTAQSLEDRLKERETQVCPPPALWQEEIEETKERGLCSSDDWVRFKSMGGVASTDSGR